MSRIVLATAASVIALLGASPSLAAALNGTVWTGLSDAQAADASVLPPNSLAHANFNPGVIDYESGPSPYTVAGFLNNPTFTNLANGFDPNGTAQNIFLEITGTIGLNAGLNHFQLGHDDGAVLSVAGFGTVLSAPGPTSLDLSEFDITNPGAAGNFAFDLKYTECCGPPADLIFTINDVNVGGVPEPATWALMLLGFGAVGYGLRRHKIALAAA